MKAAASPTSAPVDGFAVRLFAGLFGALLGLSLLKFGNPVVLDKLVEPPKDAWEWLLMGWPVNFAYPLVVGVAVAGLFCLDRRSLARSWAFLLPLPWLGWQLIAAVHTTDTSLTSETVKHFGACVVCFCLGYFCLSGGGQIGLFWAGILCGFVLVLAVGLEQHFGGLEETRRHFQIYVLPTMQEVPPELLKRMASDRIFSTLFYPNALAGALLLLLPTMLVFVWRTERWLTTGARLFLVIALGGVALACLFWSGSKGGWLLMLLLGLVALLHLRFSRQWKIILVSGILVVGLAGFFMRYARFFQRGATSVGARFDYWRAAADTAKSNAFYGTGPGTFSRAYQRIKRPEAEMSRLVHNDYLQQASDSGVPGALAYSSFVLVALVRGYKRCGTGRNWLPFSVWLGLLGWSLQGLIEFGLYIPALAWPAFGFMGWLLGSPPNGIDKDAALR